jgi:carbon dioxide concentrating mechanism protein CcmN
MSIVPSGSLIGDTSRQITIEVSATPSEPQPVVSQVSPVPSVEEAVAETVASPWDSEEMVAEASPPETREQASTTNRPNQASVVGKVYINQLLVTLFPERHRFNGNNNHNS